MNFIKKLFCKHEFKVINFTISKEVHICLMCEKCQKIKDAQKLERKVK